MRVVLDTNVLLSATIWANSVSQKLLSYLLEKNIDVIISEAILAEYSGVLIRDFEFSDQQIDELLNHLRSLCIVLNPTTVDSIVESDPDDDKVIACAKFAKAKYLITYDKHLLKINTYESVIILTPEILLKVI